MKKILVAGLLVAAIVMSCVIGSLAIDAKKELEKMKHELQNIGLSRALEIKRQDKDAALALFKLINAYKEVKVNEQTDEAMRSLMHLLVDCANIKLNLNESDAELSDDLVDSDSDDIKPSRSNDNFAPTYEKPKSPVRVKSPVRIASPMRGGGKNFQSLPPQYRKPSPDRKTSPAKKGLQE